MTTQLATSLGDFVVQHPELVSGVVAASFIGLVLWRVFGSRSIY